MEKPYPPSKPPQYEFQERTEYEWLAYEDDENDYFSSNDEEDIPKHPARQYSQLSLQDLLDLCPPDKTPSDIKMIIREGDRYRHWQTIKFYYEKHIPADLQGYEKAMEQYRIDFAQYQDDLKTYEEWQKANRIKKLEEQLAELKGNGS